MSLTLVRDRGTSLPTTNLTDGQMFDLVVDASNGVVWSFRYRAGSSSIYKWEFTGGAPLVSQVDGGDTTNSGSYGDLTRVGPQITLPTLPAGGDFDIEHGALISGFSISEIGWAYMSYQIGAIAASDTDAVQSYLQDTGLSTAISTEASMSRKRRKLALGSGITLTAKYKALWSGAAANISFTNRFMYVTPVRVG